MASLQESASMALFCDFENVALGVRDAKFEKFDIKPILERLLLKGSIVVKKAYCDWDRYKGFKAAMHEASFELIEIPHVRQSGKNSADIRLVVDALDLCYTKSHVDTFVIISGDSDFSPLVSKLRENAKKVIGVGVKQSTSDLLVANCDEFIFYDDLVREQQRAAARRDQDAGTGNGAAAKRSPDEDRQRKKEVEERKSRAIALAVETFDALAAERGESGKIWASVLKSAIKRRKPDFNESYYGFRAFGNLLDEVQARGLFEVGRDEKSGAFVYRSTPASIDAPMNTGNEDRSKKNREKDKPRKGRRNDAGSRQQPAVEQTTFVEADEAASYDVREEPADSFEAHDADQQPDLWADAQSDSQPEAHAVEPAQPRTPARKRAAPRRGKTAAKKAPAADASPAPVAEEPVAAVKKPARKSAPRARRPRKPAGTTTE
ncbi:NYN domain-containing protein [Paraburkholderia flava]|uniref:NYN domain-containing protein n=1 Tax=Paraburkholderia flava TaxID=2547393 RepID=UPI00105C0A66|nr:NYN domain-containing protein [Paraburkholderia flava]